MHLPPPLHPLPYLHRRGPLAGKMHYIGRADVHRLAKEAFLCLAESCDRQELELVRGGTMLRIYVPTLPILSV